MILQQQTLAELEQGHESLLPLEAEKFAIILSSGVSESGEEGYSH